MVQGLRVLVVLAKDWSSVPSIMDSSSQVSVTLYPGHPIISSGLLVSHTIYT